MQLNIDMPAELTVDDQAVYVPTRITLPIRGEWQRGLLRLRAGLVRAGTRLERGKPVNGVQDVIEWLVERATMDGTR